MKRLCPWKSIPAVLLAAAMAVPAAVAEAQTPPSGSPVFSPNYDDPAYSSMRRFSGYNASTLSGIEDYSQQISLGNLQLYLFGSTVSSFYVSENGYVTTEQWGDQSFTFSAADPGQAGLDMAQINRNIIAPLFMDHTTDPTFAGAGAPQVTYGSGSVDGRTAFAINWEGVRSDFFGSLYENVFQMVFIESAAGSGTYDLEFNYESVTNDWGWANSAGATVGWARYDPTGNTYWEHDYSRSQSGDLIEYYQYPDGFEEGVYALSDYNFNTADPVTGRYVVMNGVQGTVTPEPVSMVLLGSGLAGVGAMRRRRRKADDLMA